MRKRKLAMGAAISAATLSAAIVMLGPAGSASVACGLAPVGSGGPDSTIGLGTALAAVDGEVLALFDGEERSTVRRADSLGGVPRHVASQPGTGMAYVADRAGPDAVVAVTPSRAIEVPVDGEATHPSWGPAGELAWSVDLARLDIRSPDGSIRTLPPPPGTLSVFSPLFDDLGALVAVAQEPVEGADTHDETLNNLWRSDPVTGSWDRLTSFEAGDTDWMAIRTPVLDGDGSILFVRVAGDATGADPAGFELWRLRGHSAAKVRDLPGEMYLAGRVDGGLVWNVEVAGTWHLVRETDAGITDLGCGAVMVDPLDVPDPDVPAVDVSEAPVGGSSESESSEEVPTEVAEDARMAVVVGDFPTRAEALAVAATIEIPGAEVVDHAASPGAVAPDVYAVASVVPAGVDPMEWLDLLRARHPQYEERSWIVSLAGGE